MEFKQFRKILEQIIVKYSGMTLVEFMKTEEKTVKIEKEGFLTFTIEKCVDTLYIGYYREENGDLISDPIFVFQLKNNFWFPVRLEQYIQDTEIGNFDATSKYYYYPKRFKSVKSFASQCSREWKEYYLAR
ncbi:hypothetical protein U0X36_26150 [Bacillus thuringiensis]|uniref:DUF6908 domain-containing protein n=1 Tax=Bacillus thuringiensis TaxID=1428 RepID=UPI000E4C1DAE|nr:hypothetical protein [Bacillus thuringiensis]MDZ3956298.1 hypothetical protein [Bacillus thuringiensis]RGP42987.1 hypothetical protein BTW32_30390 [Bacillus thuringiensis]